MHACTLSNESRSNLQFACVHCLSHCSVHCGRSCIAGIATAQPDMQPEAARQPLQDALLGSKAAQPNLHPEQQQRQQQLLEQLPAAPSTSEATLHPHVGATELPAVMLLQRRVASDPQAQLRPHELPQHHTGPVTLYSRSNGGAQPSPAVATHPEPSAESQTDALSKQPSLSAELPVSVRAPELGAATANIREADGESSASDSEKTPLFGLHIDNGTQLATIRPKPGFSISVASMTATEVSVPRRTTTPH